MTSPERVFVCGFVPLKKGNGHEKTNQGAVGADVDCDWINNLVRPVASGGKSAGTDNWDCPLRPSGIVHASG